MNDSRNLLMIARMRSASGGGTEYKFLIKAQSREARYALVPVWDTLLTQSDESRACNVKCK